MSMVVRASIFEQVGGFDPTYLHGGDSDWLLRARQLAPVATLDCKVLYRRVHSGNLSNDVQALRRSTFRVLRDHMRRLRAEGRSSPGDSGAHGGDRRISDATAPTAEAMSDPSSMV